MTQQLQALHPFDYRDNAVAVGEVISIETPAEEQYGEFLKQCGAVCSYYGEGAAQQPVEPPPSETATRPLSSQDTAIGNVGRRNR